jgi:lysophospholipase L1-like esterase
MEFWSAQTCGVRLTLRTAATVISVEATVTRIVPADAAEPPFAACLVATAAGTEVARAEVDGGPLIHTLPDRGWAEVPGPSGRYELAIGGEGGKRDVTVWLPHNGSTIIHAVRADAPVTAPSVATERRWLHHGSSVSHGLEAHSPLQTWPQLAASELGLELTNLAIAGNAQLDYFVARAIAAAPADVITLKLGVNTINVDGMRKRSFLPALHGFLDVVRDGHPTTPIVVLTPVVSPAIEGTPGPTRKVNGAYQGTPREIVPGDGTLTLGLVRDLIRDVVSTRMVDDDLLWFGDGLELLGSADADRLWDNLHPDQAGYDLVAQRFVANARDATTPIGAAFADLLR